MNKRKQIDLLARKGMFALSAMICSLFFVIVLGLFLKARPIFSEHTAGEILFSSAWHPTRGNFGLASFIAGTVWVTAIAMFIAVPLTILTAIYLSEYAHRNIREAIRPVIDLLAGISPVIYGVWGVIAIVPLVRDHVMPFFSGRFPFFPFKSDNYTGYSIITAGIVLSVMVFPIIISITCEVLRNVPAAAREASLALGATRWQTIKFVVLRKAYPGIIAAVILGLSRAFGETMAVLMISGCSLFGFPKSIFDTAYPLSALIANTYGEMMSIPLYESAVFLAAFVLLILTALFNMAGWGILLSARRRET